MEVFNLISGICSIIGFVISVVSLFMVASLQIQIKGKGNGIIVSKGDNVTITQNVIQTLSEPKTFAEYVEKENLIRKTGPAKFDNDDLDVMTFKVKNQFGQEIECEVLFTFESDDSTKNYIVYTDNTKDAQGNTRVYASIYTPNVDESKLLPIETAKEWAIIEIILEELQKGGSEKQIIKRIDKRVEKFD